MKSIKIIFYQSAISILAFFMAAVQGQPSYQVSLYVHLHPKGPPMHLCNGIVVQSRLILTTASCLHYQLSPTSSMVSVQPSTLSVVAGASSIYKEELTLQVSDIKIAENFELTTGENDLAILRLSDPLPLDKRSDIKWIILNDPSEFDESSCLANFVMQNSMSGAESFIQSENMPLWTSDSCRQLSVFPEKREEDICSLYFLPAEFNCNALDSFISYNSDRGTGLLCENNLVGVLSNILPPKIKKANNCSENQLKAFYTNLGQHLEWLYTLISVEEMEMFEQNIYVTSLPYDGKTDYLTQENLATVLSTDAEITDTGSTAAIVANDLVTERLLVNDAIKLKGTTFIPVIIGLHIASLLVWY